MDLKKAAMDRVMKLMQNERVMKVAMNPRVMGTIMKAMALRGKLSNVASAASQTMARSLNLATREELRELRRTVRRIEEVLNEMEAREVDRVDDTVERA